ncbi:hypothetical protein GCM10028784_16620 [Myceligenerans cantabricum]
MKAERQPDRNTPGTGGTAPPHPSKDATHRRITLSLPAVPSWLGAAVANTRLLEMALIVWITMCLAEVGVMLLLLQFAAFDGAVRQDLVHLVHGETTVGPAPLDGEREEP